LISNFYEQVSTSGQLTSYFCFPEADELQPMRSYQRLVVSCHLWTWIEWETVTFSGQFTHNVLLMWMCKN